MNWQTLKALYELYETGETQARPTLLQDPDVGFLLHSTRELVATRKTIKDPDWNHSTKSSFCVTYERTYLSDFETYQNFLKETGLVKPQTRWEENDIKTLLDIKKKIDGGELEDLRQQIIEANETVRGVSLMFFKHDKYLDNRRSLVDALKIILNVDEFADDRDQQYIYKLQCREPKLIVLCENIYFLTMPSLPRKHGIELWYAGGRNVPKLEYADTRGLPIYYSCDWDRDGLEIFELVYEKIKSIRLLYPIGIPKSIEKTEHKSLWQSDATNSLSGLSPILYTEKEQAYIRELIRNNCWVIEESNSLIEMLEITYREHV